MRRKGEKMKPLRIYVAGPYNPVGCDTHGAAKQAQANVDRVIEAANIIHDKGHYAFVPHLSHYLHIHYSCKKDRGVWYYDYDNTFLDLWANAFLLLAHSFGADEELRRFKERNAIESNGIWGTMPIFYDIDSISDISKEPEVIKLQGNINLNTKLRGVK
jgi:hypothetical protein